MPKIWLRYEGLALKLARDEDALRALKQTSRGRDGTRSRCLTRRAYSTRLETLLASLSARLGAAVVSQHRIISNHLRAVFEAQECLFEMRDRKARSRRGLAYVIGVMFVASGIGNPERKCRSAFRRQRVHTAGFQPFCHRRGDPLQITEIDQAVTAGDEVKMLAGFVQPIGDFGNFQKIIDATLAREFDHVGRQINADQPRGNRLEHHAGKS